IRTRNRSSIGHWIHTEIRQNRRIYVRRGVGIWGSAWLALGRERRIGRAGRRSIRSQEAHYSNRRLPRWTDPTCGKGGNSVQPANALRLAYAFVVPEKECLILTNRPTDRGSELVAAERRNRGGIEEIARVQRSVPNELVCAPVKAICSCPRN